MESLADILRRIMSKRRPEQTNYETSAALRAPDIAPTCPICRDARWVSHKVPVGHADFGEAFPCQCQLGTAEDERRLQKFANLPKSEPPMTWISFETRNGTENALTAAKGFANRNGENHMLTLCGWYGTGKTSLLECIGRDMMAQGYSVKYIFVPDWLDQLRSTFNNKDGDGKQLLSLDDIWKQINHADVVLMDDLTKERVTEFAVEQATRLVDDRYRNRKLLAVSTNMGEDEMADIWGPRMKDRVFDSGTGYVRVAYLGGTSYRTGTRDV